MLKCRQYQATIYCIVQLSNTLRRHPEVKITNQCLKFCTVCIYLLAYNNWEPCLHPLTFHSAGTCHRAGLCALAARRATERPWRSRPWARIATAGLSICGPFRRIAVLEEHKRVGNSNNVWKMNLLSAWLSMDIRSSMFHQLLRVRMKSIVWIACTLVFPNFLRPLWEVGKKNMQQGTVTNWLTI